ncbi:hypothetical protein ACO22_07933, partial [Paracoccidioides brasiliensis]
NSEKDTMNVNNNDDNNNDSNDIVFNFSRKTDLTDSIDYRKDSKNDVSNLTNLLADDKHLSEYYIQMMIDSDEFLLQYNEHTSHSPKLLNHIEQK